jgi:hypothetical protein
MLKLVYSRGVDGRREIGRGDPSAELMIGVNGWFGGVETNEDKTGLMLQSQHLLRNSESIDRGTYRLGLASVSHLGPAMNCCTAKGRVTTQLKLIAETRSANSSNSGVLSELSCLESAPTI